MVILPGNLNDLPHPPRVDLDERGKDLFLTAIILLRERWNGLVQAAAQGTATPAATLGFFQGFRALSEATTVVCRTLAAEYPISQSEPTNGDGNGDGGNGDDLYLQIAVSLSDEFGAIREPVEKTERAEIAYEGDLWEINAVYVWLLDTFAADTFVLAQVQDVTVGQLALQPRKIPQHAGPANEELLNTFRALCRWLHLCLNPQECNETTGDARGTFRWFNRLAGILGAEYRIAGMMPPQQTEAWMFNMYYLLAQFAQRA